MARIIKTKIAFIMEIPTNYLFPRLGCASLVAIAAFLFAFPIKTFSDERPIIKAVTVQDNYPYNFIGNGIIQGMGFDVAQAVADHAGYQLAAEAMPWSRALKTAELEPAVLIFSIVRIPERENMYYWIGPFSTSVIWLYKLTDRNDIKIQNLDDVKNYLVGDTRDNATLPLLKSLGIKVDTAPSDLSSCRKFKIGRVDLVPIDQNAVQAFMSACDIAVDKVEKTIQLRRDSFLYIAVGKNTPPGIVTRLNNAFDLVRRDGTLKNINTKWGRQMSELQSLQ